MASTFDNFVNEVLAALNQQVFLPVYTNEIGDTWVYAVAAHKMRQR
jgi:hypothetical protein